MISRSDLNAESFDLLIRNDLIESLSFLEQDEPERKEMIEAFKKVIAYYSVPGTYEDGEHDFL